MSCAPCPVGPCFIGGGTGYTDGMLPSVLILLAVCVPAQAGSSMQEKMFRNHAYQQLSGEDPFGTGARRSGFDTAASRTYSYTASAGKPPASGPAKPKSQDKGAAPPPPGPKQAGAPEKGAPPQGKPGGPGPCLPDPLQVLCGIVKAVGGLITGLCRALFGPLRGC